MDTPPTDTYLLQTILKRVSRSFYLTLAVLPKSVRTQVGLAYLFARAADTIADMGELDDQIRVQCLRQFKAQFTSEAPSVSAVHEIQILVISSQQKANERELLEELPRCLALYASLTEKDQQLIAELLPIIIEGMEFDLLQFPKRGEQIATALPTMKELDYYTYAVAGCVGEFWTKMMCLHLPAMSQWNLSEMVPVGIRYGKGLQLVNILKDIAKDLRIGRCYMPDSLLSEAGLQSQDLFHPNNAERFRPVLQQLVQAALEHLDQGWQYTMAIPRSEIRLRLACMWPILIGLRTLQLLSTSENLLDPNAFVKVSRGEVYRMMATTTLTGGCGTVGTAYWGYLRKRVV